MRVLAALLSVFSAGLAVAAHPDAEVRALQPGVSVSLVAENPAVATPTGVDVDERGGVWVISCHTHFRPEDYPGPPRDEVVVFRDKDGDGRHETRSVFYAATEATMDLELGPDGWVYLAERDRVLRVKDSDGDGRGDVEENLAVLESTAEYPHNALSGLSWEPDGDLVFGLGENMSKPWTLTGKDGKQVRGTGEGGVFRCRPAGTELRRIARGFWNPFASCVRDDGEIFVADNDPGARPPCRLLHVVEGGDYGFQRLYGKDAHHPFVCWNGERRGTLPMLHPSGEAPCGLLVLDGGLLGLTWSEHQLDYYPLTAQGASYRTERIPLVHGGRDFRPVCVARSDAESNAKRAVFYFTDWVKVHYQIHGFGRVWKLTVDRDAAKWLAPASQAKRGPGGEWAAVIREGSTSPGREELFREADSDDPFLAQAALLALSREAPDFEPARVRQWPAGRKVAALLALKIATDDTYSDRRDAERRLLRVDWMRRFAKDADPALQFETLRWIADTQSKEFLPHVENVLNRGGVDFKLFEAAVAAWNTLNDKPGAGTQNRELLLAKALDEKAAPAIRAHALRLLPIEPVKAPKGGESVASRYPAGLNARILEDLAGLGDETLAIVAVRTLALNPEVGASALARVASDVDASARLRAEAVAGMASVAEEYAEGLAQLAEDPEPFVRREALRALRSVELSQRQVKRLQAVASSDPEARELVDAVLRPTTLIDGRPALDDIRAWSARLDSLPGVADIEEGRRIFHHPRAALCATCHRHSDRGRFLGPDLTGIGSQGPREQLLESLLKPSRSVAPEYQARMLTLKDGSTFQGIHLRTGGGGDSETLMNGSGLEVRIKRDDIVTDNRSELSLMPEGLVYSLTDHELRDLLAFLEVSKGDPAWR